MRIPILIFTIILLTATSLVSQQVEEKHTLVAENFFAERLMIAGQKPQEGFKAVYSHSLGEGVIHVFNIFPEGWIMVSAYESSRPVLAYSLEGQIPEATKIPPAPKMWLNEYARQIKFNHNNKISKEASIGELWSRYQGDRWAIEFNGGRDIEQLLTSNWDQGKYYNELCPIDPAGPGGRCYAGCVATAMGQIMNYFQWPDTGIGSYSYTWPPYGTISADFGNSAYEWHMMEPSLGHSNLEIAEILHHLGVSVDMEYGPNGSGMTNHKAAYSMRTYFKYSPETEYVYRDSTTLDWDSLIISHLDRKIPMYYAGWSVPNINGHAFVVDGYQDSLYYHFNWGWSGSFNGYFYTSNLNPGGSNFNLAQELIINAVPDTNTYPYPSFCQDTVEYTSLAGTLEDGSGPLYDYQDNSTCYWKIIPDDSIMSITLEFLRFNTRIGDTLTIYDGPDDLAPVLATFTGGELPENVTTPGDALFIKFVTDNDSTAEGWQAYFSCELPVYCQNMNMYNNVSDTLSDGSGSYNYHNNTSCLWMIQPPDAESVTIYFMEFETEDTLDFLEIYNLETQELLASYSGSYPGGMPDPVTSESGKLFLAFYTNYRVTAGGWKAYYESQSVGYGEFDQAGQIKISPNPTKGLTILEIPMTYESGTVSVYNITGKLVMEQYITGNREVIDLGMKDPGVYIFRIILDDEVQTNKIIRY